LEEFSVRLELEVEFPRRSPFRDLDILRVVLSDRHALVEQVRQPKESVSDVRRERIDLRVERVDSLREIGRLLAELVRRLAGLLGLRDLPRDLVPPPLQRIRVC